MTEDLLNVFCGCSALGKIGCVGVATLVRGEVFHRFFTVFGQIGIRFFESGSVPIFHLMRG